MSTLQADSPKLSANSPSSDPSKPPTIHSDANLDYIFLESAQGNLEPWLDGVLSKSVALSQLDSAGYTILHLSVWLNCYSYVSKLLSEARCPVDIKSKSQQTALSLAAARGYLPIIKLLLDKGADIESHDSVGMTPILCSAHNGQVQSLYILKARGANLEAKDISGANAMHLAASKNHVDMMRVLKKFGFKLEATEKNGMTPLHRAAAANSLDAIDYLLFQGAHKEPLDIKKRTPAALANTFNVEGPSNFIYNYSTYNVFYYNFSYIYCAFWLGIFFIYSTEMIQETYFYTGPSLVFIISLSLIIPTFLALKRTKTIAVQAGFDNAMEKLIVENFEAEKFENIPKNNEICYTCQVLKVQRAKHCRFANKCIQEYDHFCNFVHRSIGKNNHKLFLCVLVLNLVSAFEFLYLLWRKIEIEIGFEYLSQYVMQVAYGFKNQLPYYIQGMAALCLVVLWYTWWYFLMEFICISQGVTANEALNRHKCKYFFKLKEFDDGKSMVYENPFNKGFFTNWLEFLTN